MRAAYYSHHLSYHHSPFEFVSAADLIPRQHPGRELRKVREVLLPNRVRLDRTPHNLSLLIIGRYIRPDHGSEFHWDMRFIAGNTSKWTFVVNNNINIRSDIPDLLEVQHVERGEHLLGILRSWRGTWWMGSIRRDGDPYQLTYPERSQFCCRLVSGLGRLQLGAEYCMRNVVNKQMKLQNIQ